MIYIGSSKIDHSESFLKCAKCSILSPILFYYFSKACNPFRNKMIERLIDSDYADDLGLMDSLFYEYRVKSEAIKT